MGVRVIKRTCTCYKAYVLVCVCVIKRGVYTRYQACVCACVIVCVCARVLSCVCVRVCVCVIKRVCFVCSCVCACVFGL